MNSKLIKLIIPFSFMIYLSIIQPLSAYEKPDSAKGLHRTGDEFLFLPLGSVSIDAGYFLENRADFSGTLKRTICLEIFQYKNIALTISSKETTIYGGTGNRAYDPYSIRYDMDYTDLRWEHPYGNLSVFTDHICTNIINKDDVGDMKLRWYGYGLKWESAGMRIEHKDDCLENSRDSLLFLNNFDYNISGASRFSTEKFNYNVLISGAFRYDLFGLYFMIPYIGGSFTAMIDSDIRIDRDLESGARIYFSDVSVNPYFQYSYRNDIDVYNGLKTRFYTLGLKMESPLYYDSDDKDYKFNGAPFQYPDIHLSVGYGKYILDEYRNFNNDFFTGIDLIKINRFSLFINNRLSHDSRNKNFGLYPRYLRYEFEGGTALHNSSPDIVLELFYRYGRFDEGNTAHYYRYDYNLTGLRVMNTKNRTGFINNGIYFSEDGRVHWINKLSWCISGGRVFKEERPFIWTGAVNAQLDILRYNKTIPYLAASTEHYYNDESSWIYSGEAGARLHFGLDIILFYRYIYNTDPRGNLGLDNNGGMTGFRVEI